MPRCIGVTASAAGTNGRNDAEAEGSYCHALEMAGGQNAQMPGAARRNQLRPALARPGQSREARDLLAPIYGWFTEGFDTLT